MKSNFKILWFILLYSSHDNLCLLLSQMESEQRFSPMFDFWGLMILCLVLWFVCEYCEVRIELFYSTFDYIVIPAQVVENTIFPLWINLALLSKTHQPHIYVSILISLFCFITQSSIFRSLSLCLGYCSLIVSLQITQVKSSNFVFLFSNCFGYSMIFFFPYKF